MKRNADQRRLLRCGRWSAAAARAGQAPIPVGHKGAAFLGNLCARDERLTELLPCSEREGA